MTSAICATTSGVKRTVIITTRYASSTDPASERMGFEALRLRDNYFQSVQVQSLSQKTVGCPTAP